jgi:hypothetical protein
MTEDGDEVSYSLGDYDSDSDSEVVDESVSVSTTDSHQGQIQIIGERLIPQSLYDLLVPSAPTNTPLPASPETVSSDDSCEEGELKKNK